MPGNPYTGHLRIVASYWWDAVNTAHNQAFFVADAACVVRTVKIHVDVAGTNASAVTGVVRKIASGTALTGGVAIHPGTLNLKGTVNTVVQMGMSATASDWTLADGDSLAFVLTGTSTAAQGCVTVLMEYTSTGQLT